MHATNNLKDALSGAKVALICVGTPNEEDGSLSVEAILRTCESIAASLDKMAEYPVIILRSTVMPGTTENLVIPTLERISGRKMDVDFGVCFNPEFLRKGASIYDFYNPPQTGNGTEYSTPHLIRENLVVLESISPQMTVDIVVLILARILNELPHLDGQYQGIGW